MLRNLVWKRIIPPSLREGAGRVAVVVLIAGFSVWLLVSAVRASRRNEALLSQLAAVRKETRLIKEDNERMWTELEAMNHDPLFLEQLLIRDNQAAPDEKILKP